jgi:HlyD family secretion protein
MKKFAVLVVLLALAAAGAWFFRARRASSAARESYAAVPLSRGDIVQTVTASGALSARQSVDVGSEVSGRIVSVLADYNDAVTNGQLLVVIDPESFERAVEQATAELESAEATAALQAANFRRAEELLAGSLVSQADYDEVEASLKQARAAVRMKKAVLAKAQVDLSKTLVRSPIDGVVLSRSVDEGQTVNASMSTPNLFTLAKALTRMSIEADVSEADVGGLAQGEEVDFSVDAYPERTFSGEVSSVRLEPKTNAGVVTYTAVIDVDNASGLLLPGMTANASIVTAARTNVLRVPNAALRFRPTGGEAAAASSFPPPAAPPAGFVPPADGNFPAPPPQAEDGTRPPPPDGATVKTLYVLLEDGTLRRMDAFCGITDGAWTEILPGGPLAEGDPIVTGRNKPAAAAPAKSAGPANPLARGPGGPPPRR